MLLEEVGALPPAPFKASKSGSAGLPRGAAAQMTMPHWEHGAAGSAPT